MLYVPRHWWHYVESVDPITVSVNSWIELVSNPIMSRPHPELFGSEPEIMTMFHEFQRKFEKQICPEEFLLSV